MPVRVHLEHNRLLSDDYIGGYQAYPNFSGFRLFGWFGPNLYPRTTFCPSGFHAIGSKGKKRFYFESQQQFTAADEAIRRTPFLDSADRFYNKRPMPIKRSCCCVSSSDSVAKAIQDYQVMKKLWEPMGNDMLRPLGLRCDIFLWVHNPSAKGSKKQRQQQRDARHCTTDLVIRIAQL